MLKPIFYGEIPEFNQETHGAFQLEPVEHYDHIFIGVEIRELEIDENGKDEYYK